MIQSELNYYFEHQWKSDFHTYLYSGPTLANKIQQHENILDVGCGQNYLAGLFPNLVGIDPASDKAHLRCTLEEFTAETKFDVALCLGSINFGSEENIASQIEHLMTFMKPQSRIYWRCNPGVNDHMNPGSNNVPFYGWTIRKQKEFAELHGYTITDVELDKNSLGHIRIYCEWTRH